MIHLMHGPEGNSWCCFPESPDVSRDEVEGNIRTCFVIYLDFPLNNHIAKFGATATTAQLYHGRDTFEFDQGHVTKNQPITVLILLSESLAI